MLKIRVNDFALLAVLIFGCSANEGDPPVTLTSFNSVVRSPNDIRIDEFDATIINFAGPNGAIVTGQEPFLTALHNGGTAALGPNSIFNQESPPLQLVLGLPGENVLVSGDSFASLDGGAMNPSASPGFMAFSGTTNFSVIGNLITVSFTTLAGQAGFVNAFGVVFTDVEVADRTGLRFFDAAGTEILNLRCPAAADGVHQFVGAVFAQAQVASVQIDMGDNIRFGTSPENPLSGGDDFVVIDDIHYDLSKFGIN